ncbi:MAG: 16S rRNA (cytidine(1402)-2'-O)-methyltransferase [Acidobacteriota bacterium]|nr:16S rRNA (cytidine(1402)-2'-O)-methyltransferase [Acidobacteriota bacterium]
MGTLYIVGTPIGNLEDVTLRALRVLREVNLIAAEDTRRTARLLQHYSIATPTTSLHEHNERGKSPHLIKKLQDGASIAVVSDAGMPLVSDPGALLVRAAREAGIPVQVVPGPSAVTAVLAGAGISGAFAFLGFPPASGKGRTQWMAELGHMTTFTTVVFFESPHRLARTLKAVYKILGDRPIIVGREISKVFESLVERPITMHLAEEVAARGEYAVVIPHEVVRQEPASIGQGAPGASDLLAEFGEMTENGMRPREIAKRLAVKYGIPAGDIYRLCARGRD